MFDVRSDEWVFMGIPAEGWKYRPNAFAAPKDYAKYPPSVVTHPPNEPSVQCSNCFTLFATDPRRKNDKREWVYVSVNKFITYSYVTGKYRCIVPCMSSQDYKPK